MAPHFESAKSFVDVPITDEGVDTRTFLEASDDLVHMFELFGSTIFGFIQKDIRSNVTGVRVRFDAATDASTTLEKLVRTENEGGSRVATACLIRLIRGLALTCSALMHLQEDRDAELHTCFRRSYDEVLKHHHSYFVQTVVIVAIRAVPYRHDFYQRLAQGGSVEKLDEELAKWLAGLQVIVKRISAFLDKGGYGKV